MGISKGMLWWHIAILFSSLGVTTLAISDYCFEEHLCARFDISTINLMAVIFFSISTFLLFFNIMFSFSF